MIINESDSTHGSLMDMMYRSGGVQEAAPAMAPTPMSMPAVSTPHGTKNAIALTVRLDPERYRRLVAYAAGFVPRKTRQDILVEALDAYLDQGAAEALEEAVRVGGLFELRRVEEHLTAYPEGRLGTKFTTPGCVRRPPRPWSGAPPRTWRAAEGPRHPGAWSRHA
jgi:hypothetical protein